MATLRQLADFLAADLTGDSSLEMTGVASSANASETELVFAEDEASLRKALESSAGAVVTKLSVAADKPVLRVANPRLAFARAAFLLKPVAQNSEPVIHPSAVLGQKVMLGDGVRIDAGCVVGDGVKIGAHTHLNPRVVVYAGTTLGERVIVHAGAVLGADGFGYVPDPSTGAYTQFPQQGTLVLEDDVEIGANTTIDRGALEETRIGRGTKIDNLVHVGHNVRIGSNVVIAAQSGISGSCVIEDGAVLAGQVGIGDHVRIGPAVILGAQAGVPTHKKIEGRGQLFWGTPARPVKQHLREQATLARLARRSPPPKEQA